MPITYLDEEEEDFASPFRPVSLTQKKPSKVTYLDEEPIVQQAAPQPKTWKLPASSPFAKEDEIEEEGFFRQAADIPVGLAKGAAQGVRSFTDILGADNPVSQSIRGVEDYLGNLMSAQAKEDQAEIARIMQDAQDKGVLDQVMAGVKAFSVAPVDMTVQALGTMAPVIAGGLAANVAKVAATGIRGGVAAARGLTTAQMTATQAGIGAGMGAGVVKGTIYDEVKNELISQGLSEDTAHQQAVKAQEYGGKNLDQILLGAGLGAAAATTGAEKIIGGILTKTGVAASKSRIGNALKTGITEAFPEAAQGAQEQLAANLALQREGMEVPTTRGVFSSGALEGIAGFGVGAPLGAIQKASVAEDAAIKAEEANAPQTAAAIRAAGQKAATTEKDISATEQAIEETEAATRPTVPIREEEPYVQPPKEEFKAAFARMTPESIAETEANFREQLQSEDEETRVFSQNALDALAEFRAEQATQAPPVTPQVEAGVAPAPIAVEPAAAPAAPAAPERTIAEAIRDKDTFVFEGRRGAVSVEDGATVFRPFGTTEKFEVPINPNQTIGEIEGIEWARKGQTRAVPAEPTQPEKAAIIESKPVITQEEIDATEDDFEIPQALVEIERSPTLNTISDIFDTGESKIVKEGKRATKVSQTPEFYRQISPEQIETANRQIDNALRVIDGMAIPEEQKQALAEPYLLLDQDITNYESNPEYQRYKSSIRREVRPIGEAVAFPETITEVEAGVRELEQRARATAPAAEVETAASLSRVADNTATDEEVVRLARQGLVNIQDGQNVITPRGEEVIQRAGAPLPRLTPEERTAEVAAAPAAIVEQEPVAPAEEAPTVTPAPAAERVVPITEPTEAVEDIEAGAPPLSTENLYFENNLAQRAWRIAAGFKYDKERGDWFHPSYPDLSRGNAEQEITDTNPPTQTQVRAVLDQLRQKYTPAIKEVAPTEIATFQKGDMVRVPNRVPVYEKGEVVGGRTVMVGGSVTRVMPDGKVEVRLQQGGYATLPPAQIEMRKKAPTPVTTPPVTEAVTPAPEVAAATPAPVAETPAATKTPAAEPAGIAIGNRVKTKTTPQSFVVEEVLPQSEREVELGEQYYRIKNERTGEVQTVEANDIKPIRGKGAMKSAADIRLEGEVFVPVETENKYTAEEVEDIARDFFGGEIPQNVSIVDDANGEDFQFKAAFNARTGEIILNRAFLNRNKDNIGTNIAHELGHFIFGDKEVQRTFINFWSSLSKKDKNELNEKLGKMYNNVSSELQLEEAKVSGFTRAIEKYNALPLWYEFVDAIKRVLNRIFNTQFDVSNTEAVAVLASAIKRFKSGERIAREIETGILKNAPEIAAPAPEAVVEEAPAERPKRRTKMQNIIDISTGVKRPKTKLTVNEMTALKDQIKMRARRRREDKRSQREFAEELTKEIREMTIRGKVRPAQLRAIMSVALKTQFDNEASINAFNKYADKVIENANYEKDISDALSTIKRAKQLSKGKKGSSRIRHRIAELARFNPRDIEPESMEPKRVEIDGEIVLEKPISVAEYTAVLKEYMGSLGPVTEEGFRVIPEAEIVDFLERMAAQYDANVEERRKAAFAKKIQQALENKALLPSELESLTKDSPEEYEQNLKKKQEDKRLKIENAITDLAMDAQSALVTYQPPEMTADKKEVLDFMRAVNVGDIPVGDRKEFVLVANNILVNNDFSGSQKFTSIAKGQIGAMKAAEDAKSVKRNDAMLTFLNGYISEKLTRAINLSIQSIADTFRNIAGKEGAPRLLFLMGMGDLARGQANANKLNDEIANGIRDRYTQIEEETGQQISDKQGMFSMGVAGTLIQIQPDETEAEGISRIRKLILENIAVMENSPLLEDRRNVQFVKKALAEVDADTVDGVLENLNRLHPANYKALDFLMNTVLPAQKEMLKEHDELFNNQTDNYNNPFYLPIRYRRTMVPIRTPEDIITSIYGGTPTPKQAANTIKRQKYSTLPRDVDGAPMLFDFNLTKNVLDSLSSQITAAYTNAYWQQIVSFLKAPPASDAVGGTRNLSFVNERLGKLAQSRTRRAYEMDGVSRILDTVANVSRRLGIGLALGGYGQFIKQLPDQLMTTLVNVKDPQLMSESMADLLSGRANAVLRQFSIGERGEIAGGTTWTNQMEGNFDKVRRFINDGNWVKAADAFERFNNVWLFALKKSDYLAAGSGWLAYYRKYLKDKGAEFNNWDEEAALLQEDNQLRIEAALYAEQMVDMYQGSSDPTKMATLSQRGQNGWENLAKTIFIPFFSFVIQQRSRIFSDARDVAFGDSDQKNSGASGLAGTLLGILAFHTARRFALPAIAGVGASAIYALLGVDMDEPDEEKQREEANRIWRQFSGEVLSNIFFGGFGDFTEKKFIDSINYASYLIEAQIGNENVLNDKGELISFDKYQKERSPLYRYTGPGSENNLGMLDIMPGQIGELKKRIEEMTSEELAESLTPEERRVLFVAGLSEWLYTMRLNDADIARMIRRMNKDVIEQAEEREKARKRLQEIYQ